LVRKILSLFIAHLHVARRAELLDEQPLDLLRAASLAALVQPDNEIHPGEQPTMATKSLPQKPLHVASLHGRPPPPRDENPQAPLSFAGKKVKREEYPTSRHPAAIDSPKVRPSLEPRGDGKPASATCVHGGDYNVPLSFFQDFSSFFPFPLWQDTLRSRCLRNECTAFPN
jgi:hypothetical protein